MKERVFHEVPENLFGFELEHLGALATAARSVSSLDVKTSEAAARATLRHYWDEAADQITRRDLLKISVAVASTVALNKFVDPTVASYFDIYAAVATGVILSIPGALYIAKKLSDILALHNQTNQANQDAAMPDAAKHPRVFAAAQLRLQDHLGSLMQTFKNGASPR